MRRRPRQKETQERGRAARGATAPPQLASVNSAATGDFRERRTGAFLATTLAAFLATGLLALEGAAFFVVLPRAPTPAEALAALRRAAFFAPFGATFAVTFAVAFAAFGAFATTFFAAFLAAFFAAFLGARELSFFAPTPAALGVFAPLATAFFTVAAAFFTVAFAFFRAAMDLHPLASC